MPLCDKIGNRRRITFDRRIRLLSAACVGAKKEKEGPCGKYLDEAYEDSLLGEDSWEKAESRMCRDALTKALEKAGAPENAVDILIAGDLQNQCTGSGYGLASFDIPYFGLYGACSTAAEGLSLAALLIESGKTDVAAVVASSHFCSAERQFRFPLGYGSFGSPTAQNTVTGAGAFLLCAQEVLGEETCDGKKVYIEEILPGIVCDRGIKDAGNMGAAMCSAAADTIERYLTDLPDEALPELVATGDLGWEGTRLLAALLGKNGERLGERLTDCGLLIYDIAKQNVGCGGSGCGCSAVVTAGYFYDRMRRGFLSSVALVGTGAMMSPKSIKQGESIPAVAHLVTLRAE